MIGRFDHERTSRRILPPSISGSPRSRMIRSGQCDVITESACAPLLATSTSKSFAVRTVEMKLLMFCSSSMISTLSFSFIAFALLHRQIEPEARSAGFEIFRTHHTAVRFDDRVAYGKSDAHVLFHVEIIMLHAGKSAAEDRAEPFLRDPPPVVADRK